MGAARENALHEAIVAMAEVWEDTADADNMYAGMQWVEASTLAAVLHAGGRPDVAVSVVVWWVRYNPEDAEEAEAYVTPTPTDLIRLYGDAAEAL